MAIVKANNRMFPSVPSFFDNFFSRDWMDWTNSNFADIDSTLPAVNVKESDDDYVIEVAAPGLSKDDFKIDLDNNRLTISSEKQEENKTDEEGKYTQREFRYQAFQRTFHLPGNVVDSDKIAAKYKDGILCVTLPKREEIKPKPAKQIKIS
ncbi:Hsp20/alpha crystallin family protein [Prolixibacter sp. NT017]|jgi:HSP20 family protein|uniref:Hsp20/alpha crystallin family protein n=1 Tax=Prolixibacter sp. NT017 TaxID=2652390 RepID=UPI001275D1F8|nr:Hsp20/alpha crystallin family protein [Prolixibacter sp. NT017]GET26320.1 18 kDa heat shock protein [Prolixibacter sp. NT017]